MKLTGKWLATAAALVLAFAIIACSGQRTDGDGGNGGAMSEAAESGEHAEGGGERSEGGEGREGGGEHSEGGEGGEGGGEHSEGGEGREGGGEHSEGGEGREGGGEHSEGGEGEEGEHGEGGHDEGGEGEESGIYVARNETWDRVRRGAHLVLSYDAEKDAFTGTVTNTTDATLCAVRVEVHLDTPQELGPTPRTDVAAGGTLEIELAADGNAFQTWTAHPELSSCGN